MFETLHWYQIAFVIGVTISVRYFLITGLAYFGFWKWKAEWSRRHRLQPKEFRKEDILRELWYSGTTLLIYVGVFTVPFLSAIRPHTQLYDHVSDYGWAWWIISLIGLLVINDTYFYWMHRLVHHPRWFQRVHRVHHQSTNPTPFAAFAFHPYEAVLEFVWIIPLFFVVPLHVGMTIVFSMISLAFNVIGHLGVEIYPDRWRAHPVWKHLNRSTFHNDHHRLFRGNYGLYFTFWDRWMGTLREAPLPVSPPDLLQRSLEKLTPESRNLP